MRSLLLAVVIVAAAAAQPYSPAKSSTIPAANLTPIKGGGAPCPKGKWRCNGHCIPDRVLCRVT
jgi:hypothetical protein